MPRVAPFEENVDRYEAWFQRHPFAYQSELEAVAALLPGGEGLEVGVGTGLFAAPLGVRAGVEPAAAMRAIARQRGIDAVDGVAEALPYADAAFDFVLMVTTICFVDDVPAAVREAWRVLRTGGHIVVGFVDRESALGRQYEAERGRSAFYAAATFHSAAEIAAELRRAGFTTLRFRQTVFTPLDEVTALQPSRPGYGEGSFVVVAGEKPGR